MYKFGAVTLKYVSEFPRGGGFCKAKKLKKCMKLNWNFQSGVQYHTCTCLISSSFTTDTTTVGLLTCNRVSTGWSFFKLLGIKVPKNQSLIHLTKHGQKCTMEQNHPLCFLCLFL